MSLGIGNGGGKPGHGNQPPYRRYGPDTQPATKYHTKGCSRSSADSPGARPLGFAAFEPFSSCEFRASIARTPFCAILWRSPRYGNSVSTPEAMGNGPNTVSGSRVSNTELSEFFGAH